MSQKTGTRYDIREPRWKKTLAIFSLASAVLTLIVTWHEIDPALIESFAWEESYYLFGGYALVAVLHILTLWAWEGLSTRGARRIGLFLTSWILILAVPTAVTLIFSGISEGAPPLVILILFWITTRGIRAFSLSSSLPALSFLALYYAVALSGFFVPLNAYSAAILMAALFVPMHRRVADLWRPARLPRLPRRKSSAFTLIELLIVIAVLAVVTGALLTASGGVHSSLALQTRKRESLEWVRDQYALLHGGALRLEEGTHQPGEGMRQRYPSLGDSDYEILKGPRPELLKVRFNVRLRDEQGRENYEFVALLPRGNKRPVLP